MKNIMFVGAAVGTLAACAQNPDTIVAADVSRDVYADLSCKNLNVRLYEAETALGQYEALQRAERNKDTAWVTGGALLFLPAMAVAAAGPDHVDDIARLKGEVNAMKTSQISRGC